MTALKDALDATIERALDDLIGRYEITPSILTSRGRQQIAAAAVEAMDHKCFECGTDLTVVCLRCNPLADAPPPPAGDMVLVPREATEAMLAAGRRAQADVPEVKSFPPGAMASWNVQRHSYRGKDYETFEHAKDAQQQEILAIEYRAMLAAAPLPAQEVSDDKVERALVAFLCDPQWASEDNMSADHAELTRKDMRRALESALRSGKD